MFLFLRKGAPARLPLRLAGPGSPTRRHAPLVLPTNHPGIGVVLFVLGPAAVAPDGQVRSRNPARVPAIQLRPNTEPQLYAHAEREERERALPPARGAAAG